ncbi:MAG: hypothetical protein KAS32_26865, partial [Candidatus Peribacteraceae bacterium]|nr:hypothetical protein [Candidatus Peribacteraceae bacterium]
INGAGDWFLRESDAGSLSTLASGLVSDVVGSFSESTYYDLKVVVSGTSIRLYINDIEATSSCCTDATTSGAGVVGLIIRGTSPMITSIICE